MKQWELPQRSSLTKALSASNARRSPRIFPFLQAVQGIIKCLDRLQVIPAREEGKIAAEKLPVHKGAIESFATSPRGAAGQPINQPQAIAK